MEMDDVEIEDPELKILPSEESGSEYNSPSESDIQETDENNSHQKKKSHVSIGKSHSKQGSSRAASEESDRVYGHVISNNIVPITADSNGGESMSQSRATRSLSRSTIPFGRASKSLFKISKRPTYTKATRLKPYYSDAYRNLLNTVIQDASISILSEDLSPLTPSQLGSSTWSSIEKNIFFCSLSRHGRDDIVRISEKIGTKSELEVKQYINLLEDGLVEKKEKDSKILTMVDFPAAVEVGEECEVVLERAAMAIGAAEQLGEEKEEREKWGDEFWLLNTNTLEKLEKLGKEEGGEGNIQEVMPACNLFDGRKWIELSERVFMNPGEEGYEEENWEEVGEPGERPGIRGTAFEDFHALAVGFTKRVLATALFCAGSRIRAKGGGKRNRKIVVEDVEAAIAILGLKYNPNQFWVEAARRCHLQIIDNEAGNEEDEDMIMSYSEVEDALRPTNTTRSRSRSQSQTRQRSQTSRPTSTEPESQEAYVSDSDSLLFDQYPTSEPEYPKTDTSLPPNKIRYKKRAESRHLLQLAHEKYTEAIDAQNSYDEENRLWEMIGQDKPFEIEIERIRKEDRPQRIGNWKGVVEGGWREDLGFYSEWEMFRKLVGDEEFVRNRELKKRMRWRGREGIYGDGKKSEEFVVESDNDEGLEGKDEVNSEGENEEDDEGEERSEETGSAPNGWHGIKPDESMAEEFEAGYEHEEEDMFERCAPQRIPDEAKFEVEMGIMGEGSNPGDRQSSFKVER